MQPPPGGAGNIFKGMEANRRMRSATTNSTRHGARQGVCSIAEAGARAVRWFQCTKGKVLTHAKLLPPR